MARTESIRRLAQLLTLEHNTHMALMAQVKNLKTFEHANLVLWTGHRVVCIDGFFVVLKERDTAG